MDPVDDKVSACALSVTAEADGWSVVPRNRNGVELRHWGQSPRLIVTRQRVAGARIGLRVLGGAERQYWVLLDDDEVDTLGVGVTTTTVPTRVEPLTPAQEQAVRVVFADFLAWPPPERPTTALLEAAGRRLGCGPEAVRVRLRAARDKAAAFGFRQQGPLTEPGYLYALVQAGALKPSDDDLPVLLRKV